MIKLSQIYSNRENIFPAIKFRDGLNVVFANVTKELAKNASHSPGKTTLIELIDFTLLKEIRSGSFLKKKVFDEFVFFLEVQTAEEVFVTIRREVEGNVWIKESNLSQRLVNETDWTYSKLGIRKAKDRLDKLVGLDAVSNIGFSYRNGLRYCFRKQTQYENTFKVNSVREADEAWKTYLTGILGVNVDLIRKKFELNKKSDSLKKAINELENISDESSHSLEAEIAQTESQLGRIRHELDNFDFRRIDVDISKELVESIAENILQLKKKVYVIDQKLQAIEKSLQAEFSFEMDKLLELYEEVGVHFSDGLVESYENLIALNEQMSSGRNDRLKKARLQLHGDRAKAIEQLDSFESKQRELSALLLEKDAFDKYKKAQHRVSKFESKLAVLKERLKRLDSSSQLQSVLDRTNSDKSVLAREIDLALSFRDNKLLRDTVVIFGEYVSEVLQFEAFFYVKTNREGNPEFKVRLKNETSINDGFSYTRVISALFDLALLSVYAKDSFYRFCFHDGLLESLDDRLKERLLKLFRDVSQKLGLQVIITVLDSDVPRDSSDHRMEFSDDEMIRELHDRGNDGRLFKMAAF